MAWFYNECEQALINGNNPISDLYISISDGPCERCIQYISEGIIVVNDYMTRFCVPCLKRLDPKALGVLRDSLTELWRMEQFETDPRCDGRSLVFWKTFHPVFHIDEVLDRYPPNTKCHEFLSSLVEFPIKPAKQ